MANIFKEAKKIAKKHPRMNWQQAIKEASRRHKKKSIGSTSIGRNKHGQTGTSKKKADRIWKAKKPGKRRSSSGTVYYERRKNRSDAPGLLTGFKSAMKERLGKALLEKELATTVGATKKAQAKISATRKILRTL